MPSGLSRVWSRLSVNGPSRRIADGIISRANAARDTRKYLSAAVLYEEALRIVPHNAAIHIQCGHMFKEAGDFDNAECHYLMAGKLEPNNSDLALQLGHLYKVAGRPDHAGDAYRRALTLKPGWDEAVGELAGLHRLGIGMADQIVGSRPANQATEQAQTRDLDRLAPELAPSDREIRPTYHDGIKIRRLGRRRERSEWGLLPTLRGIESIRGYCVAPSPRLDLHIAIGGEGVYTGVLQALQLEDTLQLKHVFNVWLDVSDLPFGQSTIELSFSDGCGTSFVHREQVVVARPLSEADYPDSDAVVEAPGDGPLVDRIDARPSMIRNARRTLLVAPPRTVLVLRTDQLGDLIISIPAIARLRTLFPAAKLVGLLSEANRELAKTMALFDEVIAIDFPEVPRGHRRVMPLDQQRDLRESLAPYRFDMAIDLSEGPWSRPLLLLSGAHFLYGFRHVDFPWLSAGFDGGTRDPGNALECVSPRAKALGLIEWLVILLKDQASAVRRTVPDLAKLAVLGLGEADRFAVIHTGARLPFSRWPSFDELASLMLRHTGLKIVMIEDDRRDRATLAPDLIQSDRFQLIDKLLPFDTFDALLSLCAVFVGNDSGPKHLASLRGAEVVSLHMARTNWNEWGQDDGGLIVSRRVPCAGCAIHAEPDECGRGFACIAQISPLDVLASVQTLLASKSELGVRHGAVE